jgi:hypothetical protein
MAIPLDIEINSMSAVAADGGGRHINAVMVGNWRLTADDFIEQPVVGNGDNSRSFPEYFFRFVHGFFYRAKRLPVFFAVKRDFFFTFFGKVARDYYSGGFADAGYDRVEPRDKFSRFFA